jgi:NAD(P)-dependent dehydrogenase (short-subunit alcohol dehydrogenase family)
VNDLFKPFLLTGKVALVTGASSGFGRHFGTVLAQAGAKVVLAARRTDRVIEACDAGITIPKPLLELSDSDWSQVIDTNLNGVAYVTRESARRMIAAGIGGSIVNIASILAQREQKMLTNYAASKAAVVQFTRTAALELAPHRIRVNAICPGYFVTDLNRDWFKTEDGQALIRRIPQRRTGDLPDLNGPLLLLASDAGALMTGASLTVDGGHVLSSL